jgi:hypothetical protein
LSPGTPRQPAFGSLAPTVMAGKKRRSIARAKNRTVEDFLNIDISLLSFSPSEMSPITKVRNLSLILIARSAP